MVFVQKYRATFVCLAVWSLCVGLFFFANAGGSQYASTESAAENLLRWHDCSGGVLMYEQGYRCDAYAPSPFLWLTILLGIGSFVGMILSLLLKKSARS